jgi:hypothetical protein
MLKRKKSCPKRGVLPQGTMDHEQHTGFQTRESLSDLIEGATLILEKQLEDYWAIQAELDVKFDEIAASSKTQMTDLMVVIDPQIRTSDAATRIIVALERLARL